MTDTPPADWAIERALARFTEPRFFDGNPWRVEQVREGDRCDWRAAVRHLASHIERHEDPPVDPLDEVLEALPPSFGRAVDGADRLRAELAKHGLVIVPVSA